MPCVVIVGKGKDFSDALVEDESSQHNYRTPEIEVKYREELDFDGFVVNQDMAHKSQQETANRPSVGQAERLRILGERLIYEVRKTLISGCAHRVPHVGSGLGNLLPSKSTAHTLQSS